VAVLVVAALALVSLGVVAFKFLGGDEAAGQVGAAHPNTLPVTAASTSDSENRPVAKNPPVAAVSPSASVETQTAAASTADKDPGAPETAPARGQAVAAPADSASKRDTAEKTRAKAAGLAEDNPF
jgi:hypothetical protein